MASERMTAEEWGQFAYGSVVDSYSESMWDRLGRTIAAKVAEEHEGLRGEVAELLAMRDADALIISQAGRDLAAARERIAELLSLCPACGGRGWHEDHVHDPGCDGCCRNCPVAVQVECNCIGAIRAALTPDDAKEAE